MCQEMKYEKVWAGIKSGAGLTQIAVFILETALVYQNASTLE